MNDDIVNFTDDVRVPRIDPTSNGYPIDCEEVTINGVVYKRQRVGAMLYGYHEPSGEDRRVRVYDGHLNVANYLDSVGMGKIAGHETFTGYGYRAGCSAVASGDDVWEGTSATCPFPDQIVGEQFTLASSSTLDAAAGTGVMSVDVHGLDIAGNPQVEIVILNGQTPVSTVRTNWRFCQAIHGGTWGTLGYAAGTISIYRAGDATRVYNVIKTGGSMSLNSSRMVPAGKTFYLKTRTLSVSSSKPIRVQPRATATFEHVLTNDWRFLYRQPHTLQDTSIQEALPLPEKYPALCIIKATAFSATAGGDVAFGYTGWIE